jgi:multiple sugar transport system substrate-binding protein
MQRPTSPVRGKVGFAALPTESGEPGSGTLGGWQLALNARSPSYKRAAAVALMKHLTSPEANLVMALGYGRNPARRSVYEDPAVRERAPFIAQLLPIFERARPRPVTPYYTMLSDVLQSEFSAAVSGVREPGRALERAQKSANRLMGERAGGKDGEG